MVEAIILVGVIALVALAGFRMFGTSTYSKIRTFGDNVTTLTPTRGGSSYCFAAGTLVATPAGLVPIESIHAGSFVWSRDDHASSVVAARVLETFVTLDAPLVAVRVRESDDVVRSTPGHRFFTRQRGWVEAQALREDEELADTGDATLHVASVTALGERATVYNFEVEETHTYFVGSAGVWVHNPLDCNGQPMPSIGEGDPGWHDSNNPFQDPAIGPNDPGWHDPNNPFLDPASPPPTPLSITPTSTPGSSPPPSPGSSPPQSPATEGPFDPFQGVPQFTTTVKPEEIYAALDQAVYTANYDWNQRHELVNRLEEFRNQTIFVGYRYMGNLPPAIAQGIVHDGSISGYGRIHHENADQAIGSFDHEYNAPTDPTKLADAVNDHKNSAHGHSHFVSTSTNPAYVYPAFNNYESPIYGNKVGLVIVTTQGGEKIYESAGLRPYTSHGHMQGTNEQGQDFENEHVYGGAIKPSSIIYGATLPMGPGTVPPLRPRKK